MKKYELELNESELFTIINSLYDTRKEHKKLESYCNKISKLLTKFELRYFEQEDN